MSYWHRGKLVIMSFWRKDPLFMQLSKNDWQLDQMFSPNLLLSHAKTLSLVSIQDWFFRSHNMTGLFQVNPHYAVFLDSRAPWV